MNIKNNKILITGGSGYIGSCLASYLSDYFSVVTLDKDKKSIFYQKKYKTF